MEQSLSNTNKNSYFILDLPVPKQQEISPHYEDDLADSVDLIFNSMGVSNQTIRFKKKDKSRYIYFFKTDKRKRKGQLSKFCQRFLADNQSYEALGVSKDYALEQIARLKQSDKFDYHSEEMGEQYQGTDIAIFEDRTKWHPWQREIYNLIFEADGSFRKPHPRHIISLVDTKGNSGKSSFFKWLFYQHPDDLGRIGYGSASQLRSSAVNIGQKPFYIIDLARSKSKADREEDLLSILEDLKNGLVTNAMYGSGKTLIMEPPHIVVSSNYVLNYQLLSEDRWKVYEIQKNKTLGRENQLILDQMKRKNESSLKKQSDESS